MTTIQRKLDFKVRKSSRLTSKKLVETENDLKKSSGRSERRRLRSKKNEDIISSPKKRSSSESEPNSPVKPSAPCSPSKKKKEVVKTSSRETPSKSSLIDKYPILSPRKDNSNIIGTGSELKLTQLTSPSKNGRMVINNDLTPSKRRNLLLNSPIKENLSVIRDCSPTKRRLQMLSSPVKENQLKSPSKREPLLNSPLKENQLGSPSKHLRLLSSPMKENNITSPKKRLALVSPVKENGAALSASPSKCRQINFNSPSKSKSKTIKHVTEEITSPKTKRSTNPAYNLVKQSLHTAKPERLVCREKEVGEITDFLEGNLEKKSAGSLYISGAPGTGKTAALLHIIDDVKESYPCKICYLNCMMVKDSATVFKKLYQEITGKALTGKRDPTRSMEKCLTTSKSSIILVLDEIDQLDSKSQEVLYTIFEWPTLPNSKLILIGIANALDLTDRILPRLQAQPKCKPQLLNFAPYSREQIATVIQDRLKKLEDSGMCVMEASAIQFCARKVSAVAGDMRKALDVCRRSVELVEAEIRGQQILKAKGCDSGGNGITKKIGVMQISRVISEVYGTGVKTANQQEETVPLQQKLVTCSLLLMLKTGKAKEVAMGKLHETYRKLCAKRQIAPIDQTEFYSLCELLESRGLMGLKKAKEARLAKVSLKLDEKELEHALQDKILISTILQDGL